MPKAGYRQRGTGGARCAPKRRNHDGSHYGMTRKLRPDEDPVYGSAVYRRQMRDVVECPKCGERVLFSRLTWRGDHRRRCLGGGR